jgi:hypothetical protein
VTFGEKHFDQFSAGRLDRKVSDWHLVGAVTNFQEAMAQKQADDQSKS